MPPAQEKNSPFPNKTTAICDVSLPWNGPKIRQNTIFLKATDTPRHSIGEFLLAAGSSPAPGHQKAPLPCGYVPQVRDFRGKNASTPLSLPQFSKFFLPCSSPFSLSGLRVWWRVN